jgi:hypothetical protein
MGSERKAEFSTTGLVDWRARHIQDPLTRLRYLRVATSGMNPSAAVRSRRRHYAALALLAALAALYLASRALASRGNTRGLGQRPSALRRATPASAGSPGRFPSVWLVEQNDQREEYSNGLQIDCRLAVPNRRRSYAVFDAGHPDRGPLYWRSDPVGIVFHTTESLQVPFEPLQNGVLKQITGGLLEYVRSRRAYHFLVDRFGRVHRIVRESDAANHAGHSIWADEKWLYIDLNDSFLGVSFEARTNYRGDGIPITAAQMRAGTLLVEMLRARYRLAARDCITHAQVSVNPANMRIGYHTDWAANFPFREMGLPDNYARPLPGLYLCGFVYDRTYLELTGPGILAAIAQSEQRLDEAAARRNMTAAGYREFLQQQYRKKIMALRKETPEGDG